MLKPWQLVALVLLGIALWALVTWRMPALRNRRSTRRAISAVA